MKSLKTIREAKSGGKEAYQKFFNSLLKKFGVSSPAELKGDDKKKFYDELDAGWESDDPNDKNERYHDPDNLDPETTVDSDEDLADKGISLVKEALKPGKGNIKNVDVDLDATEYPGGEKAYVKDAKKKFKVAIKLTRVGALLSGKKADVIKFMMSDMYGGIEDRDIEDMWPELLEDTHYPKPLSIIRLVKEFSGDAETVRRKRRRFEAEEEEAHKMNEKMVECEHCGKMHEEGACGSHDESFSMRSIGLKGASKRSRSKARGPKLSSAELKKAEKIAKKHSGDMERAMKEIEKIKKGASETDDVMDILRRANEDVNEALSKGQMKHDKEYMHKKLKGNNDKSMKITTAKALKIKVDGDTLVLSPKQDKLAQKHKVTIRNDKDGDISVWGKGDDVHKFLSAMGMKTEAMEEKVDCDGRLIGFKAASRRAEGEKQKGKVIVDRRTKGYKEAKVRSEKAKAKREAAAKKKAYEKKYPKLDYAYGEDAELKATIEAASKVLMGYREKDEDAAANSVSSGNVDMPPTKKLKKKKVTTRY